MTEDIIDYLNVLLSGTGFYSKNYCLCDFIYSAEEKRPAQYMTNGSFEEINNFSSYSGVSYFRKSGKVRISEVERKDIPSACDEILVFSIPLKFISVVPKNKANADNAYTDEEIALKLFRFLNTSPNALKASLNAISVNIRMTEYETDNSVILREEYSNPKISDFDYNYSYLSADIVCEVIIKQSCIKDPCS